MKAQHTLLISRLVAPLLTALVLSARGAPSTVAAWGEDYGTGQLAVPADLTNAVQIAAADGISMAVKADGTVAAWGQNGGGLSQVPAGLANVAALSTFTEYTLALRQNGTVTAWGRNALSGETNVPPGLINVVAVAAANRIPFALKSDSTVIAWGQTNSNTTQLIEPGLSNVVQIAAGVYGGIALKADGTVAVLSFQTPPPPGLSNVVAVSASALGNFLALRSDGTITGWTSSGFAYRAPLPLPIPADLTNIVAISAGSYGALAITRNGTLRAWRLQFPPYASSEPWLTIPNGAQSNVVAIAAAHVHNLALVGQPTWPWITQQPVNVVTNDGATVSFHVAADAAAPLQYQWQLNGRDLPGATGATLVIDSAGAANAGFYSVLVSAGSQTIRSQPASLAVIPNLQVHLNGTQVILSWPLSGKGYWLEEATPSGFVFRAAFENVQENTAGGRMEALLVPSPPGRFFRLSRP